MTHRSDRTNGTGEAGGARADRRPFTSLQAGGAVALLLFLLYAATAGRTVGPGDSGELTAVLCTWGVAHAPGYPLISLLGNLVSLLPFPGEPAFLLNLMSALFGALACGAVVVAVASLTGGLAPGILAGLMLGASRVFWEYSLVVEVFSLNALAGALLLALLAHFLGSLAGPRPALWTWPASAFVMSATLTHHMTLVLVAVPVLIVYGAVALRPARSGLAPRDAWRAVLHSVAAGAAGLLPIFYLPLAARGNPVIEWGDASTLNGLWRLLARSDFGSGTLMSPWAVAEQILQNGADVAPAAGHHFLRYWLEIPRNFGWLTPLLALIGLVALVRRHRLFGIFLAGWFGMLLIFFLRVNSPLLPLYLGVTERFYILPNVVLAVLAGGGAAAVIAGLARRRPAMARPAAIVMWLATAGAMALVNGPTVSMRHDTFTRDLGANLLAGLPPQALLLSEGDLYHNAIYYQLLCLKQRPDVDLVDQQKMTYPWYVAQLRARGRVRLPAGMTAYDADPASHCRAWLDLNRTSSAGAPREVVAVSLRDGSYADAWRLEPGGFWWRVRPLDAPVPLARQAVLLDSTARLWKLESLRHRHHDRSWEENSRGIYVRALSVAAGMAGISGDIASGRAMAAPVGAAAAWRARAAEFALPGPAGRRGAASAAAGRAAEAETWQAILAGQPAEWRAMADPNSVVARAVSLAEEALALDPGDPVALERLVSLLPADPSRWSAAREIELRGRWLDARPGMVMVAGPYLQMAIDELNRLRRPEPAILEPARARIHRLVGLLELGRSFSRDAWFEQNLTQWRGYEMRLNSMVNGRP